MIALKRAYHLSAIALSLITLAATPLSGQCYPSQSYVNWAPTLVPALVGAAIGSAVGVAAGQGRNGKHGKRGPIGMVGPQGNEGEIGPRGFRGKHGKRGKCGCRGSRGIQGIQGPTGPEGPTGPTGPSSEGDTGESITFNFRLTLSDSLEIQTGEEIIPFVEEPDGSVTIAPIAFDPQSTVQQTTTVIINDPPFGTYHFGYQIPAFGVTGSFAMIDDDAVTSRGPTTTRFEYTLPLSPITDPTQVVDEFTYGPMGTVPN